MKDVDSYSQMLKEYVKMSMDFKDKLQEDIDYMYYNSPVACRILDIIKEGGVSELDGFKLLSTILYKQFE